MPEHSERLTLLDAFIKTTEAGCPGQWARFRELAPLLEPSGSPEEAVRRRLSRINRYDASLAWVSGGQAGDHGLYEATEIQRELLDQFVRTIHARRWSIVGYLKGDLRPTPVPVERIEANAFRFDTNNLFLRDGTEVSDVFVVPAVPASPSPAETRGGPRGGPAKRLRQKPLKRRRRRPRQDPIRAAIDKEWGPDWPPDTMSTREALQKLAPVLERAGIKAASPDSQKRAIGRR